MTTAPVLNLSTVREPRIHRGETWRQEFIAASRFRCHYCNRLGSPHVGPDMLPWHVDHKTPIVLGGEDVEGNLALACQRCNLVKASKPYKKFVSFARTAFWVPDDGRISECELDVLMDGWAASTHFYDGSKGEDRTWRADREHGVFRIDTDGEIEVLLQGACRVKHLDEFGCRCHAEDAQFAAEMHRELPRLIAEIRLLNAELAEARSASVSA